MEAHDIIIKEVVYSVEFMVKSRRHFAQLMII